MSECADWRSVPFHPRGRSKGCARQGRARRGRRLFPLLVAGWVTSLPRDAIIIAGYAFPRGFPPYPKCAERCRLGAVLLSFVVERFGPIGPQDGGHLSSVPRVGSWPFTSWFSRGACHGRAPTVGVAPRNGGACRSRCLPKDGSLMSNRPKNYECTTNDQGMPNHQCQMTNAHLS
jgi:hypothetical protein